MRLRRVLGPGVGIALAAACSLTNSLDELRGKDAGTGAAAGDSGATCSGNVAMSCATPNFGNAACGSCVSGKCCAELVSCGNDPGCRALQACVNAHCPSPTKACASAACGACFVGDSALLWLTLESCSGDCADACGSDDGGGSGGTGGLDATNTPDVQDASEAEASTGCIPQLGKADCAQNSLGVSASCEECLHTNCCSQEATCAGDPQCWGLALCTGKYCFGADADTLSCYQQYCGGCAGGFSGAANLFLCIQSHCSSNCL